MAATLSATDSATYRLVMERFGHCASCPTFFDDFYKEFVSRSAEIREMFKHTDMTKQKQLLRAGISFLILFSQGNNPLAANKIQELSNSHAHDRLNVRPDLYPHWLESLLKTIAKHDPKYDARHEAAWRAVLGVGIEKMKSGY